MLTFILILTGSWLADDIFPEESLLVIHCLQPGAHERRPLSLTPLVIFYLAFGIYPSTCPACVTHPGAKECARLGQTLKRRPVPVSGEVTVRRTL